MKLYKISITPTSNFATTLRGDTLFGQFCWAIFYSLGKERLEKLLNSYRLEKPFLIVSDAFPEGYVPKPKIPSRFLNEKSEDKKKNRKKLWLSLEELVAGHYTEAKRDDEIKNSHEKFVNMHNALNYKTFHTGDGFDPYGLESIKFSKRDVYFLLDENELTFDEFKNIFRLLSEMGYGKKATIGQGRFEYKEDDISLVEVSACSKVFMTLGAFSPKNLVCETIYYEPFTRFGKFGGSRATQNAFKRPIVFADVASVVVFVEEEHVQYIGKSIENVSDTHQDTVHQGYSIVLPLKEFQHDKR